jgi:hypothetical protein
MMERSRKKQLKRILDKNTLLNYYDIRVPLDEQYRTIHRRWKMRMRRIFLLLTIAAFFIFLMAGLAAGLEDEPRQVNVDAKFIDLSLKGGFIGFTDIDELDNAFDFGVAVGKSFIPNTRFELSVDYWSKTEEEGDEFFSTEWSYRDIILGGTALYVPQMNWKSCLFPEGGGIRPYVGAGGGLHLIKWEWKSSSEYDGLFDEDYSEEESDTEFGFHGVAGVEADITRQWSAGAEFRYTSVHDLDHWGAFAKFTYRLEY